MRLMLSTSSKMECTYQRLSVSTSFSLTVVRSGNIVASPQGDSAADAARIPAQFLLRFTDPSPFGTSAAVLADTAGQPCLQNEPESPTVALFSAAQLLLEDPFAWDQGDSFHTLFDLGEEMSVGQGSFDLSHQVVLAHRGIEMIAELSLSCDLIKKNNPEAQVSFNRITADSVFTEANLVQFVQAYFSRLHAYIPIVHQPTFQIETAPLPLLMSIFLLGSLSYPSQDAAISARDFFDLAEVYIFSHPTFRRILQQCSTESASIDKLQILQAALIIEIIQNGSSNVHTRRRLRLERHPCLVAVMRISGLLQANRRFSLHSLAGTDWQMFICDELRLRLATWTFFTDSIFATCFNKCPEIAVSEMTGDLPCEEHLFEAETVSEHEDSAAQLASAASRPQSLS
ncbi:hypothetical protein CEP54_015323 [Fusarium duplospermum]|uniref:Xylanolytic transcriptional activator regulatory domain-containing protein n=1 Tax=Fusarium duplospermum TaxID=1325734 RepID=A0A428NQ55_9HYPO|nr:hypothetical protein CEP54_015323 [Fusarium duplospermum]